MSVLNRLEIANFINLDNVLPNQPGWATHYPHIILNFRGQSTAVVATNGIGKSSINRAVYALLTRDQEFTRETKAISAPKRSGVFTHVRLEVLYRDRPIGGLRGQMGAEVPGEPYVLGFYGNSDTEMVFYTYQGHLEDCPCAERTGTKIRIKPNAEFRELLKEQNDCKLSPPREEWRELVGKHFEQAMLAQLVAYQKAGGGDSAEEFFKVKQRRIDGQVDDYDAAFFYEHIAAEVLSHAMRGFGKEGETHFEDTIMESAAPLIRAELQNERLDAALARDRATFDALERSQFDLQDFTDARQRLDNEVADLAGEAGFLVDLVERRPLLGVPPVLTEKGESTLHVANRLVLQEGVWLVPAPLLAEIWGTDPGMVNREGDRRQLTSTVLSRREVIEIPWHSFSALPERGPSARAYSIDDALALTQDRTVFAKGWSRDEALRALRYGFEYRSEEGDTNPLRRRLTALERELRTTTDERETARNALAAVKGQHTDLVARIGSLQADEYELSLVRQSGLFTESEIDDLDSTARIVPDEADRSRRARESHEYRHVELAPRRQAFGEFNAEFGEVSGPAQALQDLDAARSAARHAAEVTEQAAATAMVATATADEHRQRAEDDFKSRSEEHFQMKTLLERVERFEKAFPGEDPIGLVEQVQKDYDNATNRISGIGERSAALSKDLKSLEHLKPLHGSCRALFPSDPLEGLEADVKNSLRIALERQKSLETDAIPAASERLEELNDGMSAAFRVRAAAAEEELLGLEGRLRHRDNEAKQAFSALQSDLKQADADDVVMSRFRSAFGDHAEPAVVRQQRQGETQKNAAALSVANERSLDLSRQLDELSRAAAAAGRIANEVLETVGKESLRVHQVVDQETQGNPRREALLTYFSHVLHAPVARNEEEAWMMLTALDDARIEAPVFWFDGLTEFCRSGSVSSLEHVVVGTLTGQPTLQVQGLVDPRKVEQTRQRLQNDLRLIKASIADLDRIRVDLGLASDNSILVSQACEAFDRNVFPRLPQLRLDAQKLEATIDRVAPLLTDPFVALMRAAESFVTAGGESAIEAAKSHLGGLEAELARLKAGLPDLEKRASPESISLIRQAVRFEQSGGIARLNELADELTSLDRERIRLHEMLPRLTARRDATPDIVASADFVNRGGHAVLAAQIETITRLGNARDLAARAAEAAHRAQLICESADRAAQRELAHANERFANWHHRLYTAQSYLDDGGPSFDASFQERLAALKKEEHRQNQRSRFRLSMAANARNSERDGLGVASLDKRRIELEKDLDQADRGITSLDGAINQFAHQISRTGERARRFDKVIVSLVDAWKQARQAIADADLTDEALAAATSSKTVEIARANADSMRAISACDEDGLVHAIEGVDGDIRRFALSGRIPAIRDGRKRKDAAWAKYRKGIEGLRSDKALSLSDTDKALLEEALSQSGVRHIKEILAAFERHLTKQSNLFEQARQDIEDQRRKLSESLEAFTLNVGDNFRLLKSSLKPSNDGADAGFEIEADVIERHGIRAAVDKVISMIKLQEQQRQDRADKHADAESQKEFERRIKEEVRRIFYRSVFIGSGAKEPGSSSPRIYLRHPRIGGGRRLRLDRKVSTGQANALALLLLTKMADYAISRDENVLLATAGRRRGLISSTRVVMIDGLFSNVSNRRLIRESLDALRGLKGKFQLIGWIHNEAYENDAEIFPEHLGIRRIGDTEGFVVVDDDAPASIDLSQDILDIGPGAVSVLEMHADALPGGTRP